MKNTMDLTTEMKQFFNGCAGAWDEHCTFNYKKIAAIITLAGIVPGSHVLDIACGTGVLFSEMLSHDPAKILGVDLSDKMIEKARGKFIDTRLELLASDIFDVQETGFDTAMIFSAYPHFPDKRRLAEKVSTLLKDGGRIMVAHCESREAINRCHTGDTVDRISWPLRPVREEAAVFSDCFDMDMMADTSDLYFFSGTKKRQPELSEESVERNV